MTLSGMLDAMANAYDHIGVPRLRYEGERDALDAWAERKGADAIVDYWGEKNVTSIDGLPGLPV